MYKFFYYYFDGLEDVRESNKVSHDLYEIVFIAFISTLCGVDSFTDMEMFAKYQKDWFLKYIDLKNGVPSHDTMMRVLNTLDPNDFGERFSKLFKVILSYSGIKEEQYSMDGKSIKGSAYIDEETGKKSMIHTLNVFSNSSGLSIFQRTVCKEKVKSETEAILEALSFLDIKKKVISVDAGISYRNIADKIIEKKGHYVMSIKKNNKNTLKIIKDSVLSWGYGDKNKFEETEKAHGRNTKRVFYSYKIPKSLIESIEFKNVKYIGVYETIDMDKDELNDRRYYITSQNIANPEQFYRYCRNHWGVESMHWMLDVLFKEDDSHLKKGNAPKILLILRQLGLNLLKMDTTKGSFKSKKRHFEWNHQYRDKMLKRDIKDWVIKK